MVDNEFILIPNSGVSCIGVLQVAINAIHNAKFHYLPLLGRPAQQTGSFSGPTKSHFHPHPHPRSHVSAQALLHRRQILLGQQPLRVSHLNHRLRAPRRLQAVPLLLAAQDPEHRLQSVVDLHLECLRDLIAARQDPVTGSVKQREQETLQPHHIRPRQEPLPLVDLLVFAARVLRARSFLYRHRVRAHPSVGFVLVRLFGRLASLFEDAERSHRIVYDGGFFARRSTVFGARERVVDDGGSDA